MRNPICLTASLLYVRRAIVRKCENGLRVYCNEGTMTAIRVAIPEIMAHGHPTCPFVQRHMSVCRKYGAENLFLELAAMLRALHVCNLCSITSTFLMQSLRNQHKHYWLHNARFPLRRSRLNSAFMNEAVDDTPVRLLVST